jgi:hypothetical protein
MAGVVLFAVRALLALIPGPDSELSDQEVFHLLLAVAGYS